MGNGLRSGMIAKTVLEAVTACRSRRRAATPVLGVSTVGTELVPMNEEVPDSEPCNSYGLSLLEVGRRPHYVPEPATFHRKRLARWQALDVSVLA